MLSHLPFYHEHFRKYVTAFGTCFNDLYIVRKSRSETNPIEKKIKVPLYYSTKTKQLDRLLEKDESRGWENEFPRMSFEITGIQYASDRKENSMHYIAKTGDGKSRVFSYSPAPYDFSFQLVVYSVYQEDCFQIVEQILPFFQPEYNVKVKEVPSLGLTRDITIILNSVNTEFDQASEYAEVTNLFTATMDFTLKGYFFGPAEDKPVITNLEANIWHMPEGEKPLSAYKVEGDVATREITLEEWEDY